MLSSGEGERESDGAVGCALKDSEVVMSDPSWTDRQRVY